MTVTIFDCEQGSEDWYRARMGIPTASEFASILAKARDKKSPGQMRKTYLRKLAGEIVSGDPMTSYTNAHMERGKELEFEAREAYCILTDNECRQVGFLRNEEVNAGCSPDSLIGEAGMLEIKTALDHIAIEKIEADKFPPEHMAQCQGALWISARDWIDITVYAKPSIPLFIKRAQRDEAYIKTLADEVARFNEDLADLVERVRHYGPDMLKRDLRESLVEAE
jgi:hypothetical protein